VKVCLRDKKRQREQRIQMGMSVATSLGNGIGIGREASRTDKDRWRCSSTTLLDELYKDLSKSIPTIDDVIHCHSIPFHLNIHPFPRSAFCPSSKVRQFWRGQSWPGCCPSFFHNHFRIGWNGE
jgi:hypothetical protein